MSLVPLSRCDLCFLVAHVRGQLRLVREAFLSKDSMSPVAFSFRFAPCYLLEASYRFTQLLGFVLSRQDLSCSSSFYELCCFHARLMSRVL